jgi:hypothetical protein
MIERLKVLHPKSRATRAENCQDDVCGLKSMKRNVEARDYPLAWSLKVSAFLRFSPTPKVQTSSYNINFHHVF